MIFGVGGIIFGLFVKIVPIPNCRKFEIFKEKEIEKEKMDSTLTSKLRRTSTVRFKTIKPQKSGNIDDMLRGSSKLIDSNLKP